MYRIQGFSFIEIVVKITSFLKMLKRFVFCGSKDINLRSPIASDATPRTQLFNAT